MYQLIHKFRMDIFRNISERNSYAIFYILSAILFSSSWIIQLIIGPNSFKISVLLGIVLTCGMLLFVPQRTDKVTTHINKIYFLLIHIIGISFIINGIIFHVLGYLAIGAVFFVIIPISHIIISKGDMVIILKGIAYAIIFSFIIFMIIAILFGPGLSRKQYSAFVRNPNTLGIFMIIVVSACIFLTYKKFYMEAKPKFQIICLSFAIAFCIFSQSRTSLLAIIGGLFFLFFIMFPLYKMEYKNTFVALKKLIALILIISLSIIISTSLFYFTMTTIKKEIAVAIPSLQIKTVDLENELINADELFNLSETRFSKGIEKNDSDAFTSGRVTIWNEFYNDINLLGHEKEGKNISFNGRIYKGTNAHNVYLQVGYSAGVIAGISMVLLMLLVIKDSFILFFRHCRGSLLDPGKVFAIVTSIGFFVVSLTSGGYMMYTYCIATLFWMLMFNFTIDIKRKGEFNYDINNWSK